MKNIKLSHEDIPPENRFLVKRFSGPELFKVTKAHWNLYEDEGRNNLTLYLECDGGVALTEEISYCSEYCNWELNLWESNLSEEQLVPGFKAKIPSGYDESKDGWITNFYFTEHDGSDNNEIEIIKKENERLLIKITGEITDLNFYDGSKPNSKLCVQTWFTKSSEVARSIS